MVHHAFRVHDSSPRATKFKTSIRRRRQGGDFSYLHREPRGHQLLPTDNLVPPVLRLRGFAWAAHGKGVCMFVCMFVWYVTR